MKIAEKRKHSSVTSVEGESSSGITDRKKKLRHQSPPTGSTKNVKRDVSVEGTSISVATETQQKGHKQCPCTFSTKNVKRDISVQLPSTSGQGGSPCVNNSTGYECPICLESTRKNEMTSLPCFHAFHKACINEWLIEHRNCPVCDQKTEPLESTGPPLNNQSTNTTTGYECPICLESTRKNEMTSLACFHAFHQACINEWLIEHRSCPVCYQEIEPTQNASQESTSHQNAGPLLNNQSIDNSTVYQCPICYESTRNNEMKSLPCYHAFHQACIDEWLIDQRRCPVCHQETEPTQNARLLPAPHRNARLLPAPHRNARLLPAPHRNARLEPAPHRNARLEPAPHRNARLEPAPHQNSRTPLNNQNIDTSNGYQCPICLESTRNNEMKSLSCAHTFHQACIDQWLIEDRRCPVCRQETETPENTTSPLNNQWQTFEEFQDLPGIRIVGNNARFYNGNIDMRQFDANMRQFHANMRQFHASMRQFGDNLRTNLANMRTNLTNMGTNATNMRLNNAGCTILNGGNVVIQGRGNIVTNNGVYYLNNGIFMDE